MADRSWKYNKATLASGLVEEDGYIDITSGAAVETTSYHPLGDGSVGTSGFEKVATGRWKLTLKDRFKSVRGIQLTLEAATAVALFPQVEAKVVGANANTVSFRTVNGSGTLTDPGAATRVYVKVTYKNSDVEP